MARNLRRKHVVLAFPVSVPWMALVFRGATDYAREHGGWNFTSSPSTLIGTKELALDAYALQGMAADGAIAAISDRSEARIARGLRFPVVNFSGCLHNCGLPQVTCDDYAIGRLGAEHLLAHGLRRLAYHGLLGTWYSQERQRGFVERAREAGVACDVFEMPACENPRASWRRRTAPLSRWLKTLRPPVGVMAMHDYRAQVIIDACAQLGLDVPHDVAVLGVDDNVTVCEFCQPTLSSVSRNGWQVGYEAAKLLDRLIAGRHDPESMIPIAPDGVVARRSTDTLAVDDPHVTVAVRFMHDHLGEAFGIDQLIEHVPVSRRRLEMQFHRLLQCSPHEYLCRLRVQRAKQLLAGPEHVKMQKIAAACGFPTAQQMRLVFSRLTGMTPQEFCRTLHRRAAGTAKNSASPR
ncbi:MAG: substrate-binding domain-containing protein [Planctomycetia bacterium]|nr:substrate-binding domain-containing protein [Planctomycetia bacterium]